MQPTTQLSQWPQVPRDPSMSDQHYEFLSWLRQSMNALIGSVAPPPLVQVITVTPQTGGVMITWTGILSATQYLIREGTTQSFADSTIIGAVPDAGGIGAQNAFLRAGLPSAVTRYYWIVGQNNVGQVGAPSAVRGATTL
jgi:hypothetical protein